MPSQIVASQAFGELTLHTGRVGMGSKVGHDLTLRVAEWTATAGVADGGLVTSVRVTAQLRSLEVVRGDGGLKALTEKDKKTILSNGLGTLAAQGHPEAIFEADGLQLSTGTAVVSGRLALAGATRPQDMQVSIELSDGSARVQVRCEVVQSAYGVKPYSGMLGALKVRDMVEVRANFSVATG